MPKVDMEAAVIVNVWSMMRPWNFPTELGLELII